jgi:DNA repair exonuclease SbcCD ATPase subunit
LKIPLSVTKREEIKGDLKVSAVNLPRDINRADVNVKDKAETELYFRTTNIPVGSYTFYFQGVSKFSYKRNQDAINASKEEQKRAGELKKKYDEEAKTTTAKAAEAVKAVQTAANELKAAQQAAEAARKAAEDLAKRVAEAEKKLAASKQDLEQNKGPAHRRDHQEARRTRRNRTPPVPYFARQ